MLLALNIVEKKINSWFVFGIYSKNLKENDNCGDTKSVSSVVSTATAATDIVPSSVSHI